MESLGTWIIDAWYFIIPGFIYFLCLSKLISLFNKDFNLSKLYIKHKENYGFYINVFIITFSYIMGVIAILASQKLIWWIDPDFQKDYQEVLRRNNDASKELIEALKKPRQTFLIVRHLIISLVMFGIILSIEHIIKNKFKAIKEKKNIGFIVLWIIGIGILVLAYSYQRNVMNELLDALTEFDVLRETLP